MGQFSTAPTDSIEISGTDTSELYKAKVAHSPFLVRIKFELNHAPYDSKYSALFDALQHDGSCGGGQDTDRIGISAASTDEASRIVGQLKDLEVITPSAADDALAKITQLTEQEKAVKAIAER